MTQPKTISFVGTVDLENWLKDQAAKHDRSQSYIIRQILEQHRQAQRPQPQPKQPAK